MKFRAISHCVAAILLQSDITVPVAGLGISILVVSYIDKTMPCVLSVATVIGLPHLPSPKEIVDEKDYDSNDYRWHNYANHDGGDVDTGCGGADTGSGGIETRWGVHIQV